MQRLMNEAGLPPLEFSFTSFFTVTFKKSVSEQGKKLCESFGVKFGEIFGLRGDRLVRIVDMLEMLNQGQKLVAIQIAGKFEITTRAVAKDIKFLRDQGIIKFVRAPKTGKYVLTERGVKLISDLNISGPRK